MLKQETLEYFFENLKTGDKIGYYRSGIFSSLIIFFQKKNKHQNLDKLSHVVNVFEVIRFSYGKNKDILSFMISHQTAMHGCTYDLWIIEREKDTKVGLYKYYIKNKTKYTNMYYLQIENQFSEQQSKKGVDYAKAKIGERYGYFSIIAYIPFFSNFISKYFNFKLFRNMKPVCTTHIVRCDVFAGRNVKEFELKYPFPTPEILFAYNKEDFKGNLYEITDFKKAKI